MSDGRTEMEKRDMLRLSNAESNKLTRECIQTALIHLMAYKELKKISISEIAKKAGVSRTAFYNNYSSKEDVLFSLCAQLLDDLNGLTIEAMSEDQQFKIYTQVFQRVKNDAAHFRMLLDSGIQGEEFINVSAYVTEHYPNLNIEIRQLMFAWGGMIRSVLLDWFRRGMQENVSDMARFCTELSGDICARINAINPNFMLETERETVK